VWAAASELASAAEAVRRSAELRAEAEQSVDFTRARYEAGAGTVNDLLDAESTLTEAEATQVAAELGYRLATALVRRVQGDL
jgi:outer membrane protein TolC